MSQKTLAIGEKAPEFRELLGTDGNRYSLNSFDAKKILVIIFSCNHCPYVVAYEDRMTAMQRDYGPKGVQVIAVNSNDATAYPEDSYPKMVERAREKGFNFPYVRDEDQKVVSAYGAVCTPHVFVFDGERKLRYRGRIDDSKVPMNASTHDLRNALDDLLAGRALRRPETKPFGCSIKWYVA